ncbi:endonuclease domain-containing protein [Capsulimonas corticalis]|uniref:endonuclease domain-containing protein n=1 Tax=Capsulimonas corticalis TaxID=2219043 RepID=UPI00339D9792
MHLRGSRLQGLHFRQQQVIDGFIVDFFCHSANLVVEVDGGVHLNQQEYDQERDAVLVARGLHILRVPASDVESRIYDVLTRIKQAAAQMLPSPQTES